MDQSSISSFLTNFLLVTGILVCLKLAPSEGIHIELTNQHQQQQQEVEQNSTSSFVPTTEPYISSSAMAQAATIKPVEHRTYDAMIDHLRQLERAPEAFVSVIERLRDALKRFVDRIKPKEQIPNILQDSGASVEKKSFTSVAVDGSSQESGSSATTISGREEADNKTEVKNEAEKADEESK